MWTGLPRDVGSSVMCVVVLWNSMCERAAGATPLSAELHVEWLAARFGLPAPVLRVLIRLALRLEVPGHDVKNSGAGGDAAPGSARAAERGPDEASAPASGSEQDVARSREQRRG